METQKITKENFKDYFNAKVHAQTGAYNFDVYVYDDQDMAAVRVISKDRDLFIGGHIIEEMHKLFPGIDLIGVKYKRSIGVYALFFIDIYLAAPIWVRFLRPVRY